MKKYLYSSFWHINSICQLFPCRHIWVLEVLKFSFQDIQLACRKGRPATTPFSFRRWYMAVSRFSETIIISDGWWVVTVIRVPSVAVLSDLCHFHTTAKFTCHCRTANKITKQIWFIFNDVVIVLIVRLLNPESCRQICTIGPRRDLLIKSMRIVSIRRASSAAFPWIFFFFPQHLTFVRFMDRCRVVFVFSKGPRKLWYLLFFTIWMCWWRIFVIPWFRHWCYLWWKETTGWKWVFCWWWNTVPSIFLVIPLKIERRKQWDFAV